MLYNCTINTNYKNIRNNKQTNTQNKHTLIQKQSKRNRNNKAKTKAKAETKAIDFIFSATPKIKRNKPIRLK